MKIALVGQKHYPYSNRKFVGGREISEHCLLKVLSACGNLDYITSSSSSHPDMPDITLVSNGIKSASEIDGSRGDLMKASRARNDNIKQLIAAGNYDFVFVNDDNPSIRFALARDLAGIPAAAYFHIAPSISPGLGVHNYIDSMIEMHNSGQGVVHVSEQSAKLFFEFSKKFKGKLKNHYHGDRDTGFITHIIPPAFAQSILEERPKKEDYVVLIGRPAKYKRHDEAIRLCAEAGLPLHIITNDPANEQEEKFLEKIKSLGEELLGDKFVLHFNINEYQKHQVIAGAQMHLICSDGESFGITVIEAGMYGVPTFLYCRKPELQCAASLVECRMTPEKDISGAAKDMYRFYMSCNEKFAARLELETIRKYSFSAVLTEMKKLIEDTQMTLKDEPRLSW